MKGSDLCTLYNLQYSIGVGCFPLKTKNSTARLGVALKLPIRFRNEKGLGC